MRSKDTCAVVVGAGAAGITAAIGLAKRGIPVVVVEGRGLSRRGELVRRRLFLRKPRAARDPRAGGLGDGRGRAPGRQARVGALRRPRRRRRLRPLEGRLRALLHGAPARFRPRSGRQSPALRGRDPDRDDGARPPSRRRPRARRPDRPRPDLRRPRLPRGGRRQPAGDARRSGDEARPPRPRRGAGLPAGDQGSPRARPARDRAAFRGRPRRGRVPRTPAAERERRRPPGRPERGRLPVHEPRFDQPRSRRAAREPEDPRRRAQPPHGVVEGAARAPRPPEGRDAALFRHEAHPRRRLPRDAAPRARRPRRRRRGGGLGRRFPVPELHGPRDLQRLPRERGRGAHPRRGASVRRRDARRTLREAAARVALRRRHGEPARLAAFRRFRARLLRQAGGARRGGRRTS